MILKARDPLFALLEQTGPFAVQESALDFCKFSTAGRTVSRQILAQGMASQYRSLRNQIFELLDVEDYAGIRRLIDDESARHRADLRAYALLGNMFGLEGNQREVISKIHFYSSTADGVIRYLRHNVMRRYASYIEMTNEIDATSSPLELLLVIFDDRYHKKARFEAKRKLVLMNLAASIAQREREIGVERKFLQFLGFLNDHVWCRAAKIGELEPVFLLSSHDPEDFSCTDVRVIDWQQARETVNGPGRKLTLVKRRRFSAAGREIPIYVAVRKKSAEAKVLKLLRKGEENPAVAVDDELGLMAVLQDEADIKLFQKHLTKSAIRANSLMTLEDMTDTMDGSGRHQGNTGSSSKTRMLKFFARMGGMRVEFIVHTNASYLNYIYQRDVSHDEYEIKRLFDSGVAELLFPSDIYFLDMEEARVELITRARTRIEEP